MEAPIAAPRAYEPVGRQHRTALKVPRLICSLRRPRATPRPIFGVPRPAERPPFISMGSAMGRLAGFYVRRVGPTIPLPDMA